MSTTSESNTRNSRTLDPRAQPVGIIGAGVAGLITAYTLLRDGFTDVQILTRDRDVGGVWSPERVYPGLLLNNIHGEYRLSPLDMPPPATLEGRLGGDDMANYMQTFASKFLQDKILFSVNVSNIRRSAPDGSWLLDVQEPESGRSYVKAFSRIVVCTGGCSTPKMPEQLASSAAAVTGFRGLVFHSAEFRRNLDDLLSTIPPFTQPPDGTPSVLPVVVIGGGKSAQDISAYLANEGRKVTMICPSLDAFTAGPKPAPDFLRKSRLLSLFSPHIHLRTSLERFLHTTRPGKQIVDFMWKGLAKSSFEAMGISDDSPLRNTVSPFWHIRVNDEGVPRQNGFHPLAVAGKIEVVTPAHVVKFGESGVILDDGRSIPASAVILCTGYQSSWGSLFEEATAAELGLHPHPATSDTSHEWNYTTLSDAPTLHPDAARWSSRIYRGIVPAQNIDRRDFAINGACVSPNYGYTVEVASHWISSYFLGDEMKIPTTPEAALAETERAAAWLRRRYPQIPTALNSSSTSYLAFWTWPQHADDLLEDMGLRIMRSGGNGLTWPFKVIDLAEIKNLKEERDANRAASKARNTVSS